ncbi:SymE family type I addiction module toxin [Providencia rettgeri]|uniref:SymE family type I addiction module toxin n=2 Tax=Morganellaceae TaxID=1903414 RepID=UPI002551EAAD|nr:SymE family type I addiction module toxin [Providencia rettgeri]MDK7745426.1 SymE family type I addiction module toxin [Providencia rettgeri]MDK7757900.1 SymE family type I addiction module toxin [Providencia rettgeri]
MTTNQEKTRGELVGGKVITMAKRDCRVKTPTTKEEVVKTRQVTVGYALNRGNPNPQLTLSGKWLKEMGFEVGSRFTLTRQAGQLIYRRADPQMASPLY